MMPFPEIVFTVTNDLTYDQRMHRICTSLCQAGYKIKLIGRQLPASPPLDQQPFEQVRLTCRFNTGKLFYLEYNLKLYRYLAAYTKGKAAGSTALCAIDLDTILPVLQVSRKRKIPVAYDAHELFTELVEVKRRKIISAIWNRVERIAVPKIPHGYTVNDFIAGEFKRRYGVDYAVVRNMPARQHLPAGDFYHFKQQLPAGGFFLYQGAVNEGRCFETLIPAMKQVNASLVIAGEGNFFEKAKAITRQNGLEDKVIFLGYLKPAALKALTPMARAGITIFENLGLNQYYSLANRYFDYIQGGIPQLCVDYPEYHALNKLHETALLINNTSPNDIAGGLNKLLYDDVLYGRLRQACPAAAAAFNWEKEAEKLVAFWKNLLPIPSNA